MKNIFKTERPVIALILGFLLLMKLSSALSFIFNTSGIIAVTVGLQMVFIAYVMYGMNSKGGGETSLKTMSILLIAVMVLDFFVIYMVLNGASLRSESYPSIIGAELTYIITISYLLLSKKLKRFKSIEM